MSRSGLFAALAALLLALPAAARNVMLTHQGYLLDSEDKPVNTQHAVTIKLWSSATAATADQLVWSDTWSSVAFADGHYAISLGDTSVPGHEQKALPASLFASSVWLSVSIDDAGELLPRLPLAPVPLAGHAFEAEEATHSAKAAEADHAANADHAKEGDHAAESDHAKLADAIGCVGCISGDMTSGLARLDAAAPQAGSLNVSGTITGAKLVGDGSALTGIDAAQIGGKLQDAQLASGADLAKLSGTQTFTGDKTFTGAANFKAISASGTITGSHVGDGSGLTNLNASAFASGTIPDARLGSNIARTDATNQLFTANQNVFRNGVGIGGDAAPATTLDVRGTAQANAVVETQGLTDAAAGAAVTITGGSLSGGGPTMRGFRSSWATPANASLTVDLRATVVQIARVTFGTDFRTDTRYPPADYKLEYSTDNATWTTFASVTGNTAAQVSHSVGFDARYIRLTVLKTQPGQTSANVSGLQILTQAGTALAGRTPFNIAVESGNGDVFLATPGNVGLGTSAPQGKLDVAGTIRTSGAAGLLDGYGALKLALAGACIGSGIYGRFIVETGRATTCAAACSAASAGCSKSCVRGWTVWGDGSGGPSTNHFEYGNECSVGDSSAGQNTYGKVCCCVDNGCSRNLYEK